MPKRKKGKKGKKKAKRVSTRRPFDYEPLDPLDADKNVILTVKLLNWGHLDFKICVPLTTPLATIKHFISERFGGSFDVNAGIKKPTPNAFALPPPLSGPSALDHDLLARNCNRELRLWKDQPFISAPLPDDDLLTLAQVGYRGACPGDPPVEADVFYDFAAAHVLGTTPF